MKERSVSNDVKGIIRSNNSMKVSSRSHIHNTKGKKKTLMSKGSQGRVKTIRRSIIREYYLKCRLTWEYADIFSDIDYWHESIKGEDTEKQPIISTSQEEEQDSGAHVSKPIGGTKHLHHMLHNDIVEPEGFTILPNENTSRCLSQAAVSNNRSLKNASSVATKSSTTKHKEYFPAALNESSSLEVFSEMSILSIYKQIQTGERPYKCPKCPKMFSVRWRRNRHLRNNCDEKPYKCEQCPKTFSWKRSIKHHLLTHHSGRKPRKCTQCSKTFLHSGHLKRHLQTHLVEKP